MKKAMTLLLVIIVPAIISMPLCRVTSAVAANSVTRTVGTWQVTLTDLGLLPGGSASSGLAINNTGQIAGLATDSSFALQRPIWDANTGIIIGTTDNWDPASTAVPEHRNDNGEMVGTEVIRHGTLFEGVYWNAAGRAFGLPSLPGVDPIFGPVHVAGHGINNQGQMAGGAHDGTPAHAMHAVLWQNKDTPAQDLGFLGQGAQVNYSEAYGINNSTHVVGNSVVGSAIRGFLWRADHMIDLGGLSGQVVSEAYAISNNGVIVGKSNFFPVLWTYDVTNSSSTPAIRQLPIPPGFFSAQPTAVNDSADVVGYAGSPNIDSHAILWHNGQAIDLGVWPGGHYSVATGINGFGQIVGTGTIAGDNLDHALMWTVTPAGGGGGGGGGTTNTTPSATLRATSSTSIRVGGSVSVQAGFTDPDNGPWSYRLDWGDGSATTGGTSTAGAISGISPHVYRSTGSFRPRLSVTDAKGAVGRSSTISVRVR
jgi:probable HAF family extracellular repeat protein